MNSNVFKTVIGILGINNEEQVRKVLGLKSLIEDFQTRLDCATTTADCLDLYQNLTKNPNFARKALEKSLSLATTIEECRGVDRFSTDGSNFNKKIMKKIIAILQLKLETVITTKEALEIFCYAPENSNVGKIALEKALGLAKTWDDCWCVYNNLHGKNWETMSRIVLEKAFDFAKTFSDYYLIQLRSFRSKKDIASKAAGKIVTLLQPQVEKASTSFECLYLHNCCPYNSELRKRALEKALNLATTIEEYKRIYGCINEQSPEAILCIKQITTIVKEQAKA